MKYLLLPLIFFIINCSKSQTIQQIRHENITIKEINMNNVVNVIFKQGDIFSVMVDAKEDNQPFIKTEVVDNQLNIITSSSGKKKNLNYTIYITLPKSDLVINANSAVNVSSDGVINMNQLTLNMLSAVNFNLNLNVNHLKINGDSAVNIDLSGNAETGDVTMNSTVNINAGQLKFKDLKLSVNNSVGCSFNADHFSSLEKKSVINLDINQ